MTRDFDCTACHDTGLVKHGNDIRTYEPCTRCQTTRCEHCRCTITDPDDGDKDPLCNACEAALHNPRDVIE